MSENMQYKKGDLVPEFMMNITDKDGNSVSGCITFESDVCVKNIGGVFHLRHMHHGDISPMIRVEQKDCDGGTISGPELYIHWPEPVGDDE